MNISDGDILEIGSGVILHQVNCIGKTGGMAGALRRRFPRQFQVYLEDCSANARTPEKLLGLARCGYASGVAVIHCFGQLRIGKDRQHTDMVAAEKALASAADGINSFAYLKALPVFAPYFMGCGRGQGDWAQYSALLERYFPGLTIVRHPKYARIELIPC